MHPNFFSQLRVVIALDKSRISLGDVVIDFINEEVIPDLQKKLKRLRNQEKRAEVEEKIEEWKKWGDSRDLGKKWNTEAVKVIVNIGRKMNLNDYDLEDMASEILLQMVSGDVLKKHFDVDTGPEGLMKFFKFIIDKRAKNYIRDIYQERAQSTSLQTQTEEGDELIDTIRTRDISDLDKAQIEEVRQDMYDYVRRNIEPSWRDDFETWVDVASEKGPINVSWSSDLGVKKGKAWNLKKAIYGLFVEYLESEFNEKIDERTLKSLKLAERIARKHFRMAFVRWMLNPYLAMKSV